MFPYNEILKFSMCQDCNVVEIVELKNDRKRVSITFYENMTEIENRQSDTFYQNQSKNSFFNFWSVFNFYRFQSFVKSEKHVSIEKPNSVNLSEIQFESLFINHRDFDRFHTFEDRSTFHEMLIF